MTDDNDNIELSRRKILASAGAVGAAGIGAGLGTNALFSDEESFTDNSITAGTLDMSVTAKIEAANDEYLDAVNDGDLIDYMEEADGAVETGFSLADFKPGDWVIICAEITVSGNPGCVTVTTEDLTNYENGLNDPETDAGDTTGGDPGEGDGELGEKLVAEAYQEYNGSGGPSSGDPRADLDERDSTTPEGQSLNDFDATYGSGVTIGGSPGRAFIDTVEWYLLLELPSNVGNVVQSDSVEFDATFDVTQARNNDDCQVGEQEPAEPECAECTAPDPGTNDFDVSIESIDDSAFPTVEATARVDTPAGGAGDLGPNNFQLCEETVDGLGDGYCGQNIENVSFGGEQEETLADIMFVLDTSGSMSGDKMESARDGAITLIGGDADITNNPNEGGFDSTVNVGLVEFDSIATLESPLGTDHDQVESAIDGLTGVGQTDVGDGIERAQDEFDSSSNNRSNAPDFMIVLGNGDTSGGGTPATNAKDKGTTIYGIAYGTGAQVSDFSAIAGEEKNDPNYQDYTFDADEDDITEIFGDIASEIFGTYTLEYETGNFEADGNDRDVLVYVDDPDEGDADATGSYTAPS